MCVTLLAATLAACGSTPATPTGPTWTAQPLWNGDVESLRMANDASQRLFLVWSSAVQGEHNGVWAAVSEPDGRWSTPARLSSNGSEPRVGAGGGAAMAVWWEPDPPRLQWSRWDPAGWSAPRPMPAGQRPFHAEVSVDATGEALAAWFDRPALMVATFRLGRGWDPPQVIATAASNMAFDALAAARAGTDAVTLWSVTTVVLVRPFRAVTSLRWIDAAWRSASFGGGGTAAVTFHRSGAAVGASATVLSTIGFPPVRVSAFVGLPAGDWAEETLSTKGLFPLDLARSSTGEVGLLYGDSTGSAIELFHRAFDGRLFQAPERVRLTGTSDVDAFGPIALGASDDSPVAAWFEGGQVWAAVRSGSGWSTAEPIGTSGADCPARKPPALAASSAPQGLTVVWSDRGCALNALWVARRPRD
jgi:hypothetical protein